ncbi:MAG: peptidoglycan glycosyltransferase [Bacillales bacterium]|jgi:penicillin-binding protein|nr:peptidoglycan glycosyltransferase [Bacillales bacterium]
MKSLKKFKIIIHILLVANSFAFIYLIFLYITAPLIDITEVKTKVNSYETPSTFYYSDGSLIGNVSSPIVRKPVEIKNISKNIINALVATEDQNFYNHFGFDLNAITRATISNLKNGKVVSGGSTITQQLVKNQILTDEVTYNRKVKELIYSIKVDATFSKNEIIELYLNVVPFGRSASGKSIYGIEAAANGVFGKSADKLTVDEAAFLIGIIQSPNSLTPFTKNGDLKENLSHTINRKNYVLKRMYDTKQISNKQLEKFKNVDIIVKLNDKDHYTEGNYLLSEVERRATEIILFKNAKNDGFSTDYLKANIDTYKKYYSRANQQLKSSGYKIYTTIDKQLYDTAQTVSNTFDLYGPDFLDDNSKSKKLYPVQVGAIIIENTSGKILSFIGGRDFTTEQVNHATQTMRQNGSTMKPLAVYAPAIETGLIQPGSVILDLPTNFQDWHPKNFNNTYHGLTSIRQALAYSYNIPAAKIYSSLPNNTRSKNLSNLGITTFTNSDYKNLSLSLGAAEQGVKLEELTNAYSIFPNHGYFKDAFIIDKITQDSGKIIYKNKSKQKKVYSKETTFLVNSMLKDVVNYGTASSLKKTLNSYTGWAGKTGTTQNNTDSLFIAYNSKITVGIWMGYDSPKYKLVDDFKGLSQSERTLMLFSKLVNELEGKNKKYFSKEFIEQRPKEIIDYNYCALSGLLSTSLCAKSNLELREIGNRKYIPKKLDDSLINKNNQVQLSSKFFERYNITNKAQARKILPNSKIFEKLYPFKN